MAIGYISHHDCALHDMGHHHPEQPARLSAISDRLIATAFGKTAVDVIAAEDYGKMVAWKSNRVTTVSLEDVFQNSPRLIDPDGFWVETARSLGIYVGEEPESHDTCSTQQNGHHNALAIETATTMLN